MTIVTQKVFDNILSKLKNNYENVSLGEYKNLVEFFCSRYTGGDIILNSLSNKQLRLNTDYFGRSYFESVFYKKMWGSGSKHQILSCLYKASYGLTSESRKKIFKEKDMFIEEEKIGFGNRSGFAHFKFFIVADTPYLFLIHQYGDNSITNKIEELVTTIEKDFLEDIGFNIMDDKILIFYKDTGNFYDQVILEQGLVNPVWRTLEMHEQQWFDNTWDSINFSQDETEEQLVHFFEKGRQFDGYRAICDIMKNVQKEIVIVDNYVDSSLFVMLADLVKPNIKIKLLTSYSKFKGNTSISLDKFKKQHLNFQSQDASDFHDRYIIADESCYLLGASIKDFANKATTLVSIKEKPVISAIRKYVDDFFN